MRETVCLHHQGLMSDPATWQDPSTSE